jgi:hypothetical protein
LHQVLLLPPALRHLQVLCEKLENKMKVRELE